MLGRNGDDTRTWLERLIGMGADAAYVNGVRDILYHEMYNNQGAQPIITEPAQSDNEGNTSGESAHNSPYINQNDMGAFGWMMDAPVNEHAWNPSVEDLQCLFSDDEEENTGSEDIPEPRLSDFDLQDLDSLLHDSRVVEDYENLCTSDSLRAAVTQPNAAEENSTERVVPVGSQQDATPQPFNASHAAVGVNSSAPRRLQRGAGQRAVTVARQPAPTAAVASNTNYCELGETLTQFSTYCSGRWETSSEAIVLRFQDFLQQATQQGGDLTQLPAGFQLYERELWGKLQVTSSNVFIQIRAADGDVRVGTRTGRVDPSGTIVWLSPPEDAIEPDRYFCRMRNGALEVFGELCPALESRELSRYVRMHRYYQHRVEKPKRLPIIGGNSAADDGHNAQGDGGGDGGGKGDGDGQSKASGKKRPGGTTGAARSTKKSKASGGGAAGGAVNAESECRDAVQALAWRYFVDGALCAEQLLPRLLGCAFRYQHANPDAPPLSARTVLGWIAAYDELSDCVLQEVPAADFQMREAQFRAECASQGWFMSSAVGGAVDAGTAGSSAPPPTASPAASPADQSKGETDMPSKAAGMPSPEEIYGPGGAIASSAPGVEFVSDPETFDKDLLLKTSQDGVGVRQRSGKRKDKADTSKADAAAGPLHAVAVPVEEDGTTIWKALLIFALLLLSGITYKLYFPTVASSTALPPTVTPTVTPTMVPTVAPSVPPGVPHLQVPATELAPPTAPRLPVPVVPAPVPSVASAPVPSEEPTTSNNKIPASDSPSSAPHVVTPVGPTVEELANAYMKLTMRSADSFREPGVAKLKGIVDSRTGTDGDKRDDQDAHARDNAAVLEQLLPKSFFTDDVLREVKKKTDELAAIEQRALETATQQMKEERAKLKLDGKPETVDFVFVKELQLIMEQFQSSAHLPEQTVPSPNFSRHLATLRAAAQDYWSNAHDANKIEHILQRNALREAPGPTTTATVLESINSCGNDHHQRTYVLAERLPEHFGSAARETLLSASLSFQGSGGGGGTLHLNSRVGNHMVSTGGMHGQKYLGNEVYYNPENTVLKVVLRGGGWGSGVCNNRLTMSGVTLSVTHNKLALPENAAFRKEYKKGMETLTL